MARLHYLKEQKRRRGRKILGVFPAQYPKEILWSQNILPVEIWDPPLAVHQANAHLQPYICPVVKVGLELVLGGGAALVDGFLFPHTCDSIQNLASVVHDHLGMDKPCYFFYHPKAPYQESARVYYRKQLQDLAHKISQDLGPWETDRLAWSVEQGERTAALIREIYSRHAQGVSGLSNLEFYAALRRGEWLWPEDFNAELEELVHSPPSEPDPRPAVLLSGVLPNPAELLELLGDLQIRVAGDDLLAMSRRLLRPPVEASDPWQALSEAYFSLPPCSTKDSAIQERLDYLLSLVERTQAKGIIFQVVKFCEPELFDVPILAKELRAKGVPTLTFDVELNEGLSGQMRTRVEAFVELLGKRG